MKQKIQLFILLIFTQFTMPGATKKLNVTVDERIELLTAVQLIADYPWLTRAEFPYKTEVRTMFGKYKNHKAVAHYKAMSAWLYGYKPLLFLCHYKLPSFAQTGIFTEEDEQAIDYKNNKDSLDRFITELKDFYELSDFHHFLRLTGITTTVFQNRSFAKRMQRNTQESWRHTLDKNSDLTT